MKAPLILFTILSFVLSALTPFPAQAVDFRLPVPGVMVPLSPAFNPPILRGIKVHTDNPFRFDFILDKGDSPSFFKEAVRGSSLKLEANKLIKYFLASLTIPEQDLWVNLSPYEKNRIIPQAFGKTEMGRDLLAEDYMLKQITASLIFPEGAIGKKFWKRIYEEAAQKFGTTNIPVNTFNKVWIVPDKAVVYENAKAGTAYVVENRLKVMLEQDYLSIQKHQSQPGDMFKSELEGTCPQAGCQASKPLNAKAPKGNYHPPESVNTLGSQIIREIIIPELNKEVNQGLNFSQLRQVYNSLILAEWYKKKIKDSILTQVYENKKKISGILSSQNIFVGDPNQIYHRYLQAFKKGAYNYIKEEQDTLTNQPVPKKYFSGGMNVTTVLTDLAYSPTLPTAAMIAPGHALRLGVILNQENSFTNAAMKVSRPFMGLEYGEAKVAFEDVRNAMNQEDPLRPFIFFRSRIDKEDVFGGPAMFEHLIRFFAKSPIREHYGLQAVLPILEEKSGQSELEKLKLDMKELQQNVPYESLKGLSQDLFEGNVSESNEQLVDNFIVPFLKKYFKPTQGEIFGMKDILNFLSFLMDIFNFWDRKMDRLKQADMEFFFREMPKMNFAVLDPPFIQYTPKLMQALLEKGFITNEDYQEIMNNWAKLSEKYLTLNKMKVSREVLTGKEYIKDEDMMPFVKDKDAGHFMGEYYELTRSLYPLLSKILFKAADDIEPRSYLPETERLEGFSESWKVKTLESGYFRDWNNLWQTKHTYAPNEVKLITYDGDLADLKLYFERNPEKMFEIFTQVAKNNFLIDDSILEIMRAVKKVPDEKKRIVSNKFKEFYGSRGNIAHLFVRMLDIGLIDKVIPELTDLDNHYPGPPHRFSLSYHTAYLLYFVEHGMKKVLDEAGKMDSYKRVMDNDNARLILRFSILLHDTQKDPEYQALSLPHTVEGSNSLTYRVLSRFEGMEYFADPIAFLVWNHQRLNERGKYTPEGIEFTYRDLLDIISYYEKLKPRATVESVDIWNLLTIADTYAVDPHPEAKVEHYLSPVVHSLHDKLVEYYSLAKDDARNKLRREWEKAADIQDSEIRDYYKTRIKLGEIRDALEKFKPFVADETLNNIIEKLDYEVAAVKKSPKDSIVSLGQLPPGSYFKKLYDEYSSILATHYLRKINVDDGSRMSLEMIMYALMRDSSDRNLVLSLAGEIQTGLGNLFNLTVNVNHDKEGTVHKILGLMTALGLNVVNSYVRTLKKPESDEKIIVDQFEGYYLPGSKKRIEEIWPKLKELLIAHHIPVESSVVYHGDGSLNIDNIISLVLNALIRSEGETGVTIDKIFDLEGVVNYFEVQQKNVKLRTKILFGRDKKGASSLSLETPDRNGLLYTFFRIAGEGFKFNVEETSLILTSSTGVSDTFTLSKKEEGQKPRALKKEEKDALKEWVTYFFNLPSYSNDYLKRAIKAIQKGMSLAEFISQEPVFVVGKYQIKHLQKSSEKTILNFGFYEAGSDLLGKMTMAYDEASASWKMTYFQLPGENESEFKEELLMAMFPMFHPVQLGGEIIKTPQDFPEIVRQRRILRFKALFEHYIEKNLKDKKEILVNDFDDKRIRISLKHFFYHLNVTYDMQGISSLRILNRIIESIPDGLDESILNAFLLAYSGIFGEFNQFKADVDEKTNLFLAYYFPKYGIPFHSMRLHSTKELFRLSITLTPQFWSNLKDQAADAAMGNNSVLRVNKYGDHIQFFSSGIGYRLNERGFLNRPNRVGVNYYHPLSDSTSLPEMFAYSEGMVRGRFMGLSGVFINPLSGLRGSGLFKVLLSLFFTKMEQNYTREGWFPHTEVNMNNIFLHYILMRDYGFGPDLSESSIEPSLWMRVIPPDELKLHDGRKYQVYVDQKNKSVLSQVSLTSDYEVLKLTEEEFNTIKDGFTGIYVGKSLVVRDQKKFQDAIKRVEIIDDFAMKSNPDNLLEKQNRGGIDLTSQNSLTVQDGGQSIAFHINPAQLVQLQASTGFSPTINEMEPLADLRTFLNT